MEENRSDIPGWDIGAIEDGVYPDDMGVGIVDAELQGVAGATASALTPGESGTRASLVEVLGKLLREEIVGQFLEVVVCPAGFQGLPPRLAGRQFGEAGIDPAVEQVTGSTRPPAGFQPASHGVLHRCWGARKELMESNMQNGGSEGRRFLLSVNGFRARAAIGYLYPATDDLAENVLPVLRGQPVNRFREG